MLFILSNYMYSCFSSVLWCTPQFLRKNDIRVVFSHICFVIFMLFLFIYVYWCPTWFPFQMMFVSFYSNKTGVINGAGTANPSGVPEFTTGFSEVRAGRSLILCIVLSVLLLTVSDNTFDIFKLFLAYLYKRPLMWYTNFIHNSHPTTDFLYTHHRLLKCRL